jgi:hypothetical protein
MLLVVNQGPGRISDWWYGKPDHTTAGSVPVASVTRDEGEVLIKELTSGNKRVRLAVEAHPSPEYLYDLADHHIGAVPEDPSAKTGPRDLARVDVAFALPPGKQGSEMRDDYPPYHWEGPPRAQLGNALSLPFRSKPIASRQRTDWVSAGGVRWQQSATIGTMLTRTDTLSYKAGSVQKENWFGPITRPRMLTNNVLLRFPNGTFATHIQGYGDAGAAHTGLTGGQTISVYQGDKRLVQTPIDSVFVGDLEPEKLPYRLVVDTMGNPEHGPYSTTTKTEWSFTSGHATEEQEIPLVQLDYGTNLDVMGRAERRTDLSILPTVLGGTSAEGKVSSVGLEVSYDDGRTWQRHTPKRKKDAWQASLNAPSNAQYVSIRVTARQPNGSGITQTITRAFGLRP